MIPSPFFHTLSGRPSELMSIRLYSSSLSEVTRPKPAEKLLDLLREVYQLSYSSKVKDECTTFGKEVKKNLQFLAPPQVSTFSTTIRKEIETFCNKPNETRWSLRLLRNCVSPLIEIKTILGTDNPYYRRISTQIADNALYASEIEIDSAERKLNNP